MDKGAKSKKEAKDEKLKDQKLEEQILADLQSAGNSVEEQFQLLLKKHVETERSNRLLKQDSKGHEKRLEVVLREKENLQRDYNKSVLMRDKLEEVCREQQKIIKSMKNENLAKLREEEERRKETQVKFQASLNEISQSLSKNNDENLKLRDHNIEMTKKLKFLAEQYQVREQQLEKLNEQIQLESQLQQAKLTKVQVQSAMEKEILLKEKQNALERLSHTQTILKDLTEREQALKEQLNFYTSKYDDFQSSLQKSNDIFATYKVELEKLSKNTRKIEKESLEWKRKWEKSNATLIELATEKQERDDHAARCTKQVDQLQKLLRALQHERTHLYKTLRDNEIELPTLPELPPEPEPMKIVQTSSASSSSSGALLSSSSSSKEKEDKDKMEMMTKNCAEIKQTLASLQSQIKSLKLKETEANALLKLENSVTNIKQKQQQQQRQARQQDETEVLKKQQQKKQKKQKSKNKQKCTIATEDGIIPSLNAAPAAAAAALEEPKECSESCVSEKLIEIVTTPTQADTNANANPADVLSNGDDQLISAIIDELEKSQSAIKLKDNEGNCETIVVDTAINALTDPINQPANQPINQLTN